MQDKKFTYIYNAKIKILSNIQNISEKTALEYWGNKMAKFKNNK